MAAINLNFDDDFKKINLERNVVIGGKEYHLVFDDEMFQKITDLQIAETGVLDEMVKGKDQFVNDMTVDQRKKFIKKTLTDGLSELEASLDAILGKGEGERLYKHFGKSTYVLNQIAQKLIELNDRINGDQAENEAQRKKAIKQHYNRKNGKKKRG